MQGRERGEGMSKSETGLRSLGQGSQKKGMGQGGTGRVEYAEYQKQN